MSPDDIGPDLSGHCPESYWLPEARNPNAPPPNDTVVHRATPLRSMKSFLRPTWQGLSVLNQRLKVAEYLATCPEALEVLSMAYAAMLAERRSSTP